MGLSLGQRLKIRAMVYVAGEPIPYFWPMRSFIHHNPLHGLERRPFEDAVEEVLRGPLLDVAGWLKARRQLLQLRRFLNGAAGRAGLHLVWFGNHKASYGDSGLAHMSKLLPLLETSCRQRPVTLTVIICRRADEHLIIPIAVHIRKCYLPTPDDLIGMP